MLTTCMVRSQAELEWPALLEQVAQVRTPWVVFSPIETCQFKWEPLPQVQATIMAVTEHHLKRQALQAPAEMWQGLDTTDWPFYGTYFDTALLFNWRQPRLFEVLRQAGCLDSTTGPLLCWLVTLTHNGLVYLRAPLETTLEQPLPPTPQLRWQVLDLWNRLVMGHCT